MGTGTSVPIFRQVDATTDLAFGASSFYNGPALLVA